MGKPLIIPTGFEGPMMIYLRCASASKNGTGLYDNGVYKEPPVPKGGDCSATRKRAKAKAMAILEKQGADRTAQAAEAEAMLADVDDHVNQPEPSQEQILDMLRKQGKLPPKAASGN